MGERSYLDDDNEGSRKGLGCVGQVVLLGTGLAFGCAGGVGTMASIYSDEVKADLNSALGLDEETPVEPTAPVLEPQPAAPEAEETAKPEEPAMETPEPVAPVPAPADPAFVAAQALWAEVCANAVPGKWVKISDDGRDLPAVSPEGQAFPYPVADMSPYKGGMVDLVVTTPKTAERLRLNGIPGDCLEGKAPRALAADRPVAAGKVIVTNASGASESYHFSAAQPTADIRTPLATEEDLVVSMGAEDEILIACNTPVRAGCEQDVQFIVSALEALPKVREDEEEKVSE